MGGCLKVVGYIALGIIGLSILAAIVDEFTNTSEGKTRVVNTPVLNVREGPGANLEKVGEKRRGDTIKVIKDSAGWSQFVNRGTDADTSLAWVKKTYIGRPGEVGTLSKEDRNKGGASKSASRGAEAASYEIVRTDDYSSKNYGTLNPEYDISEAPEKRKVQYHIALGLDVNKEQIEPTAKAIVQDITEQNPEVDEVMLELYSEKSLAKSRGYGDIASGTWAPKGELGNMTPEIARTNNRDNYDLQIEQQQDNLNKYLELKKGSKKKFGLSESERKKVYRALFKAEYKASDQVRNKYESSQKEYKEKTKLIKKYTKEVREKYDITKEEADKISKEAFNKNWRGPKN